MLRHHPLMVVACTVACAALMTLLFGWVQSRSDVQRLAAELSTAPMAVEPVAASETHSSSSSPVLPVFDSAALAKTLGEQAAKLKLDLAEVNYTLDETASLPYLRYRVTLTLDASYPTLRRYVAGLQSVAPHVSLDGVHCSREDIGDKPLSCDLSLSAFYQRGNHG
ncbi:hypothetical protein [Chitinimonas sp. BJYL2]|uniref:hypothetical protein n=1 Tax=Chitinimonas sp. BJYL2 TaxID=2976696 RepID=UPI0022B4CE62|nr:hypothetical protein [Chitinimonas sp. BJYL2]